MQSVILYFLLSATAFTTAPAAPQEPLIVRSEIFQDNLEVLLANLQKERVSITVTDLDSDRKLYSDVITGRNGYSYGLCLSKLPRGRYVLAIKKGNTLRQQVILKDANGTMCSDWK